MLSTIVYGFVMLRCRLQQDQKLRSQIQNLNATITNHRREIARQIALKRRRGREPKVSEASTVSPQILATMAGRNEETPVAGGLQKRGSNEYLVPAISTTHIYEQI